MSKQNGKCDPTNCQGCPIFESTKQMFIGRIPYDAIVKFTSEIDAKGSVTFDHYSSIYRDFVAYIESEKAGEK